MYSSGESLCIMRCVSNMMKPQKMTAPATEMTNSIASLQKKIWDGGKEKQSANIPWLIVK